MSHRSCRTILGKPALTITGTQNPAKDVQRTHLPRARWGYTSRQRLPPHLRSAWRQTTITEFAVPILSAYNRGRTTSWIASWKILKQNKIRTTTRWKYHNAIILADVYNMSRQKDTWLFCTCRFWLHQKRLCFYSIMNHNILIFLCIINFLLYFVLNILLDILNLYS